MGRSPEPVVLELATLPREQVGPFLLLGLDKAADKKAIDAHWADRLKWARKGIAKVPLEDINWAREILNDIERRIRADAASLNADTSDSTLAQFAQRYGMQGGQASRMWQAQDSEKALADYRPPAEAPDAETVRVALTVPEVPEEVPAVPLLLERITQQPLDPWAIELPRTTDERNE
ncbi:MAG TPA: hypothetical protein VN688_11735 [Gemmataceae bacterium]|nr:hypothetical protein [Gemmataceae bacterium]